MIHCLDAHQHQRGLLGVRQTDSVSRTIASFMRKTSLVPVISDFLFEDLDYFVREMELLSSLHDVFLVMIDSAFAFELPNIRAGWIDAFDVETSRSRLIPRGALGDLSERTRAWQDRVARMAKDADLDVLCLGIDEVQSTIELTKFVAERRLRKR